MHGDPIYQYYYKRQQKVLLQLKFKAIKFDSNIDWNYLQQRQENLKEELKVLERLLETRGKYLLTLYE